MVTHLSLMAVQVIFAVFPIAAKIAFREMSPWSVAWVRLAAASVILLVWFGVFSRDRVTRFDYGKLALFSLFGVTINQLCYLKGLSLTTAINATILVGMIPVFTFLMALALRREDAGVLKVAGIVLAFVGVFLLAGPGMISMETEHALGNILLLCGAFGYSAYLVLARRIMSRYHPMTVVTWVFVFGSIAMLPFAWGDVRATYFPGLGRSTWVSLAFLTVLASIVAYYLTGVALKQASATLVAVYICTQPILVAILAVPLLGETITWTMGVAAILIFGGVVLTAAHRPPILIDVEP